MVLKRDTGALEDAGDYRCGCRWGRCLGQGREDILGLFTQHLPL